MNDKKTAPGEEPADTPVPTQAELDAVKLGHHHRGQAKVEPCSTDEAKAPSETTGKEAREMTSGKGAAYVTRDAKA